MIYETLAPELRDDPQSMGYAGKTDEQRLALLTGKTRSRPRRVGSLELLLWGGANGRLAKIRRASGDANLPDSLRAAAIAADTIAARPDAGFDGSDDRHLALVAGLVAGGILTAEDQADLLELATEPCSRAEELGLDGLGVGHLASARQMIGG